LLAEELPVKPAPSSRTRPTFAVGVGALITSLLASAVTAPSASWQSRVSRDLLNVYTAATVASAAAVTPAKPAAPAPLGARFDSQGRVQVDVHVACAAGTPAKLLSAAGLNVGTAVHVPPYCVVEGWMSPTALPAVAAVSGVTIVRLPSYAFRKRPTPAHGQANTPLPTATSATSGTTRTQGAPGPAIDGTAVTLMRADQFISQTGVNGSGVTVGVMSDDATSLALIAARGELPATVADLTQNGSANPAPTDEGTMMLEEVHAVAPGATLLFCGSVTAVGYVACLGNLVAAGATIIVDDIAVTNEDMMSAAGAFAQAVQSTLSQNPNAVLFTAVENYNGSYWEGAYAPVSLASLGYGNLPCAANGQSDAYLESFDAQYAQELTIGSNGAYSVAFQWADPFGQNVSNFDLYVGDPSTGTLTCYPAAGSSASEMFGNLSLSQGNYLIYVATPDASLSGKFLKMYAIGPGGTLLSTTTSGSIISPQAFLPGVLTVGAVVGSDGAGNQIESYSSRGPINLIFPVATPLQAPTFVAPDAIYVDAAGTDFTPELWPDGYFHGTSAAAPNAAAVAALIRAAFPSLTPAQVSNALQSGAAQLSGTVPDGTYGYGRVDAVGTLNALPSTAITGWTAGSGITIVGGSSSPAFPFTVTGTGGLHFSVTSTNAALLPGSITAPGSAGVAISCDPQTSACDAILTPAMGRSGTTTVTISVTDGAGRSASVHSPVTVVKPPAPTVKITANASQTVVEGGAAGAVTLVLTGTGPLTLSVTSNNTSLLPASSITLAGTGCGPTVNHSSCVASLAPVASQSGSVTVSFVARDAYGQAGNAASTLQVNAPPNQGGGGGGSVDALTLLALVSLALCRAATGAGTALRS
jgi:hypothetical protein